MISALFKKLASLPGINWFNRKDKIEYDPAATEEHLVRIAKGGHTYNAIKHQNYLYYTHMMGQAQYIKAMHKLINEFDLTVEKWDDIQMNHEHELEALKAIIRKRDIEIAALQKAKPPRPVKQIQNVTISDQSVDKLIAHMERIALLTQGKYSRDKEVKRAREMHNTLHNFLQKLRVRDGE